MEDFGGGPVNFHFPSPPLPSHFSAAGKTLGWRHISVSILVATPEAHYIQDAKSCYIAAVSLLLGGHPFGMLSQLREVTAVSNATWRRQC